VTTTVSNQTNYFITKSALAKPGKDPHLAASYQPISLLSICYKLLECTILQRISPTVEDLLSVDQAGFRHGCSTCDQDPGLTVFTENGFEETMKTSAVFLDLTAAYDTIWLTGLLYKLSSLVCSDSGTAAMKPPFPGPYGR